MERYRDYMMVESIFALVKSGKLYARKILMADGMSIRLMLHADCLATKIMVIIVVHIPLIVHYLSDYN